MCPLGYHVVKGHYRICKNETKTWVDTQNRRNRSSKKTLYLSENLLFLFWNSKNKYPKIKGVKGFSPHHELDAIIQFWFNYWKKQGLKFHSKLTPLHIKFLIAVESSFRSEVKAKTSTASGLMQLLAPTLQRLKGIKANNYREVYDHYVSLKKNERSDPVLNIAAGTRWLSHKYEQLLKIKKIKNKSLKSSIKYYHSWTPAGDEYAEKILKLFDESK